MMRTLRLINSNTLTTNGIGVCESLAPNSVYTQFTRWKRKPIWLPTAKTKVFRVSQRPAIPVDDHNELKKLFNNYRTYMTSLRAYIRKVAEENEKQDNETAVQYTEEEDFQACSAINDKWNAEITKIREVRLEKLREKNREKILKKLMKAEEFKENRKKIIDEKIRKAKTEAHTFITAKNIDAAIEECLQNIVNHNRAIDLDGNWYDGKYPPAPDPVPVETIKSSAAIEQQT